MKELTKIIFKEIKEWRELLVALLIICISLALFYFALSTPNSPSQVSSCSVSLTSEDGQRIYLKYGTIFALDDELEKKYYIVKERIFHLDPDSFKKIKCYGSEEEAAAEGYSFGRAIGREEKGATSY